MTPIGTVRVTGEYLTSKIHKHQKEEKIIGVGAMSSRTRNLYSITQKEMFVVHVGLKMSTKYTRKKECTKDDHEGILSPFLCRIKERE